MRDRRGMVPKLAAAIMRLNMVVAVDWVKRIDAWRAKQPGLPSRSAAIRDLVTAALDAAEKPGRKHPKGGAQ
jgi:hypothetical protein